MKRIIRIIAITCLIFSNAEAQSYRNGVSEDEFKIIDDGNTRLYIKTDLPIFGYNNGNDRYNNYNCRGHGSHRRCNTDGNNQYDDGYGNGYDDGYGDGYRDGKKKKDRYSNYDCRGDGSHRRCKNGNNQYGDSYGNGYNDGYRDGYKDGKKKKHRHQKWRSFDDDDDV